MRAAASGIGKSVGDRDRSAALNELLMMAVRTKMAVSPDDSHRLSASSMHTSVGVFRPNDEKFYAQSCVSGGPLPGCGKRPDQHVLGGGVSASFLEQSDSSAKGQLQR